VHRASSVPVTAGTTRWKPHEDVQRLPVAEGRVRYHAKIAIKYGRAGGIFAGSTPAASTGLAVRKPATVTMG
jgi:hypothetical protein